MSTLTGTSGSDTLTGTSGSDKIISGAGDDTLIYNVTDNTVGVTRDVYTGGSGIDTVELQLTEAQWASAEVQSELTRYSNWLIEVKKNLNGEVSNGSSSDFTFSFDGSTLTVQMMEALRVMVDIDGTYVEQDLNDDPVTAMADFTGGVASTINVLANDSVPDLVGSLAFANDPAATQINTTYGKVSLVQPDASDASSWYFTYQLNDHGAAYGALVAGETVTNSFDYRVTDTDGDFATATVTITVTGINDQANISDGTPDDDNHDFSGAVTEAGSDNDGGTANTNGKLIVIDRDAGQSLFTAVTNGGASYGTYSLTAAGDWTYTLDNTNASVDALAAGATLEDSFTVRSVDGSAERTVIVTINGASDVVVIPGPVANPDVLWVTNNTNVTLSTGVLLANDSDAAGASLSVTALTAGPGLTGLTLNTDGSFSFASGATGGTVASPTAYTFSYTVTNAATSLSSVETVTVNVVAVDAAAANTIDLSGQTYAGAYLAGGSGPDTFKAGSGDTTMVVGQTTDILTGGSGTDTAISFLGLTNAAAYPTVENFTLAGSDSQNTLVGNDLNNVLTGRSTYGDSIFGGAGNDTLYALGGDDRLDGQAGDDALFGGDGNDLFNDLAGSNMLTGGAGADVFRFNQDSMNTVLDFSSDQGDKLFIRNALFSLPEGSQFTFSSSDVATYADAGAFLYNSTTGQLFFGSDQFGLIGESTHPALTVADFDLIGFA